MLIFGISIALFILASCSSNSNEEGKADSIDKSAGIESTDDGSKEDTNLATSEVEELDADKDDSTVNVSSEKDTTNTSSETTTNPLAQYSSEQIEYARVWLLLGPNPAIDELHVQHIQAGSPLDPEDDTSVTYPEDVIQLRGSRLVDGMVTYSGNGDGTINVYNVPISWYGGFPSEDIDKEKVREDMKNIIEHPELVYVDPGDDAKIIELIEMLNVHN